MQNVKRLELSAFARRDERGWGLKPLDPLGLRRPRLGNFHVVSMKPGAIRGNHLHGNSSEWLVVCGGPAKLAWRSPGTESTEELTIEGTDPELLEVPAGVEHAIVNLSAGDIYLVAFSEADDVETVSCSPLIES